MAPLQSGCPPVPPVALGADVLIGGKHVGAPASPPGRRVRVRGCSQASSQETLTGRRVRPVFRPCEGSLEDGVTDAGGAGEGPERGGNHGVPDLWIFDPKTFKILWGTDKGLPTF